MHYYMSSLTPSVTLVQDTANSLDGINLKWSYVAVGAVQEISLIYFKNASDADIICKDIASGCLKCNLNSGFESGQTYSFQLQVTDVTGLTAYSTTLPIIAPYFLQAPVISGIVGGDASLKVQLAPSANMLGVGDTVEFVLKRADNVLFWIIKPFASGGSYKLSSSDNGLLANNTTYRVACMYQPSSSNSRYLSPSAMSASMSATPSNTPNGVAPVTSSVGTTTLDL
jgi:hypothetical protein